MSSETSTDATSFRPWHLFVLAGLLASTAAVLLVRPDEPVRLVLLVSAIGSAAGVGFAVYRTVWPLTATELHDGERVVGGRTRAALEREKTHLLRAIKELEFDRAMDKVSEADFVELSRRLRAQAVGLMKRLDTDGPVYRDLILKELSQRLALDAHAEEPVQSASPSEIGAPVCAACRTVNDSDARFCKACGGSLEATA